MLGRPKLALRSGPAASGSYCSATRRYAPPPSAGRSASGPGKAASLASSGGDTAAPVCWLESRGAAAAAVADGCRTPCPQLAPWGAAIASPAKASRSARQPGCRAPAPLSDAGPGEPRCHPPPGAAWSPSPGAGRSSLPWAPLFGGHGATVQHRMVPVQALLPVKGPQEGLPEAVPQPFPLPAAQPVPAGLPAAIAGWYALPSTPRGQDVEDTVEGLPIVCTWASGPCRGRQRRGQDRLFSSVSSRNPS